MCRDAEPQGRHLSSVSSPGGAEGRRSRGGFQEAAAKRLSQLAWLPSNVTPACLLSALFPTASDSHHGLFSLGVEILFVCFLMCIANYFTNTTR